MDGVSFRVVGIFVHYDDNFSYDMFSDYACCHNRDGVNFMIIYDSNIKSTARIGKSRADIFIYYFSVSSTVDYRVIVHSIDFRCIMDNVLTCRVTRKCINY